MSDQPPPLPPAGVRDPGDAWVYGPEGEKFWGRYGAAGLLVVHDGSVLLQLRVGWSHFGGTWGLPGGALKQGETADAGASADAAAAPSISPSAAAPVSNVRFMIIDSGKDYGRMLGLAATNAIRGRQSASGSLSRTSRPPRSSLSSSDTSPS